MFQSHITYMEGEHVLLKLLFQVKKETAACSCSAIKGEENTEHSDQCHLVAVASSFL